MLSAADKQRYARHLLLVEVGEAGQERLCAAQVELPADMDLRAAKVARDYLERAGVVVGSAGTAATAFADRAAVQALAGDALLEPAAAALLGALHAVEQIKMELGVGETVQLPAGLQLSARSTETELHS
jgi:hypothetical protein